jgi:hypothetical protein
MEVAVKSFLMKDLMVPLSEYATVTEDATLYEAVLALEAAQENFEDKHTRYCHRAILILDKDGHVIGKLSQLDVLRALEPKYRKNSKNPYWKITTFLPAPWMISAAKPESRTSKNLCILPAKANIYLKTHLWMLLSIN